MNKMIDRDEFWMNKYYRLPRSLVFNHLFWDRSTDSRSIFLLIGIKCSGIRSRKTCFIGYRSISNYCNIPKNNVSDILWELIEHDLPLIKMVREAKGSKSINYGLCRPAIADFRNPYFPFYGQILLSTKWKQLSDLAKDIYLMIGGVSFQYKSEAQKLDGPTIRISNILDVESVLDCYESVIDKNRQSTEFIDIESIFNELEHYNLIKVDEDIIKIPLLNPENFP